MYINRTIKEEIFDRIKTRPVVYISGARQVGKSTLCKEIIKELSFNYVTLDDIREKELAIKDPELFLKIHKWPLIIDEVQYAPKLFEVIQSIVNKENFDNGSNYSMFVLTGSQSYQLMDNVTQSMAGRVSIIKMSPLSMSEINGKEEKPFQVNALINNERVSKYNISLEELYSKIIRGFYPELYKTHTLNSNEFYSNYVRTYLERDVSNLINLNNKLKFQNFMEILASMTSQELVYEKLSKAIGVDKKTIQNWISILVSGDIITLLQPYNEMSIVKRIVKRPKVYFNDTGLACYLARINDKNILMNSMFNGSFVETYIFNEIVKSYTNNIEPVNFYYYRDTNQNEIDLIILNKGVLTKVECKAGISYKTSDVKSFNQLDKSSYKLGDSCIICNTEKIYSIDKAVIALPISAI
ncbi:MAG: ATP-binding protein [Peptostreptococcaceae bacterium]